MNIFKMPAKSKWIDVGLFDGQGTYKLVQMRFRLDNNKKEFRTASMGFVNDYSQRSELFKNTLAHNAECDEIEKGGEGK